MTTLDEVLTKVVEEFANSQLEMLGATLIAENINSQLVRYGEVVHMSVLTLLIAEALADYPPEAEEEMLAKFCDLASKGAPLYRRLSEQRKASRKKRKEEPAAEGGDNVATG